MLPTEMRLLLIPQKHHFGSKKIYEAILTYTGLLCKSCTEFRLHRQDLSMDSLIPLRLWEKYR